MNPITLDLLDPARATKATPPAGTSTKDSTSSADSFGTVLNSKLSILATAKTAAPAAATKSDAQIVALKAKIAKMLKAGASESQIVATLAAQLGASVAQALGTPSAAARARLQAVFANALAPPAKNGTAHGSIAERTRTLAQRFLHLQQIATSVIETRTGQQNRIAGNFLDAASAKETPAHLQSSTDTEQRTGNYRATLAASTAEMPSNVPFVAQAAVAVPVATRSSSAAGEGRTVKIDAETAVARGGDTLLGRILTRASLAADARETPLPSRTVPSVQTSGAPSVSAGDAASLTAPDAASLTPPDAASHTAPDAAGASTSQTPVAAFLKSFEAAIGAAAGTDSTQQHDEWQSGAALPPAPPAQEAAIAPASLIAPVAPFRIEQITPAAAPTATVHTPSVDQSAIVDQVLRGAFMRNMGESSEMRLSLVPETLGDVNIKLIVSAGNVTAHVLAQSPEVRDALMAAQPQLTKSLTEAGLKLQTFTVDLAGNGFAGFSQQQAGQQHNGERSRQTTLMNDESFDESSLDAIPSFAPSLATTSAGDYNYLA